MAQADRASMEEIILVDDENELDVPPVQRQDSLYVAATRATRENHHGQDSSSKTLRLAFQCVGILYGDIGTSPLFVYSSTFREGVGHPDDLLGALSLIIYSFLLFTVVKYVYITLRANDDVLSAVGGLKEKAPYLTTVSTVLWNKVVTDTKRYAHMTGTEALFSDLGYFSIRSIQLSFGFGLVPSVLLAYIGQAAYLRVHPEDVANTFYRSTPKSIYLSAILYRFAHGAYMPVAMSAVLMVDQEDYKVFQCVARYGYRDPFEESKDFVDALVERLQYYIRDINLYSIGCHATMIKSSSYCSSHVESFGSHEKPSVKAIYAEEMITPAESFSEHTMHASGRSKHFLNFRKGR
ncbi:hypothetical protein PR202_gb11922 [Eleusine coracana subsp. coracana]|uniref:K+ potassium transporter integral membrane domain-containing protein n=1 Tax=Eleusine coracana subsp. coracana TaxID=191504 RepID=A0AAV5EP10_ELECO|nr:hypothetical protein PR202_gb11922 [Eleusine coracana subsp. coracana]